MNLAQRIHGLDLARAVAIFGMIYAHLTQFSFPGANLPHGYSSALFAVLAGASVSIMVHRGHRLPQLLLRGVIIMAIGLFLMSTQTGIVVVLNSIAWILFLMGPVAAWPVPRIAVLVAALVVVGPGLAAAVLAADIYNETVSGVYPLLAWLAYGAAGVLIHRALLDRRAAQAVALVVGALAVGLSYRFRYPEGYGTDPGKVIGAGAANGHFIEDYLDIAPHSGGLADVVLSIAFAVAVISLCLLLCSLKPAAQVTYPVRAVGSMALTVYVAHVLFTGWVVFGEVGEPAPADSYSSAELSAASDIPWPQYQEMVANSQGYDGLYGKEEAWWDRGVTPPPSTEGVGQVGVSADDWYFWETVGVSVVFASAWRWRFRRGPVEELVARAVKAGS
ncbi:hypothetical protein CPHO_11575 [Corynebacterium phocae]|uniref:DUF418 domain-containing protein n=1 Tax=Corynebacterium phocae TaxID=161895 RepID=A0A1L7D606_9CORY|nr:DUF418 domain-containing protein [Corynebacterium phocae]APT93423.1 hypothetical protein CPHO_11575 [Corynebacterium phocae]KAA8721116.1 DUF418 domain-containing protein [Corynebacterium phocae]